MTVVKYGFESSVGRKKEEALFNVFQQDCLQIVLGTCLTDHILNRNLCKKIGSIPLSRAMMREKLRWLGHALQIKDDILLKIVLF
jgi:hypothetical protein